MSKGISKRSVSKPRTASIRKPRKSAAVVGVPQAKAEGRLGRTAVAKQSKAGVVLPNAWQKARGFVARGSVSDLLNDVSDRLASFCRDADAEFEQIQNMDEAEFDATYGLWGVSRELAEEEMEQIREASSAMSGLLDVDLDGSLSAAVAGGSVLIDLNGVAKDDEYILAIVRAIGGHLRRRLPRLNPADRQQADCVQDWLESISMEVDKVGGTSHGWYS